MTPLVACNRRLPFMRMSPCQWQLLAAFDCFSATYCLNGIYFACAAAVCSYVGKHWRSLLCVYIPNFLAPLFFPPSFSHPCRTLFGATHMHGREHIVPSLNLSGKACFHTSVSCSFASGTSPGQSYELACIQHFCLLCHVYFNWLRLSICMFCKSPRLSLHLLLCGRLFVSVLVKVERSAITSKYLHPRSCTCIAEGSIASDAFTFAYVSTCMDLLSSLDLVIYLSVWNCFSRTYIALFTHAYITQGLVFHVHKLLSLHIRILLVTGSHHMSLTRFIYFSLRDCLSSAAFFSNFHTYFVVHLCICSYLCKLHCSCLFAYPYSFSCHNISLHTHMRLRVSLHVCIDSHSENLMQMQFCSFVSLA